MVLWELHKVSQRILIENERELVVPWAPVGYHGDHTEERLEPHLYTDVYSQSVTTVTPNSLWLVCLLFL